MNRRRVTSWRLAAMLISATTLAIASVMLLLLHPTARHAEVGVGVATIGAALLAAARAQQRVRRAELLELVYLRQDLERVTAEMADVKGYARAIASRLQEVDASLCDYVNERTMRRYQLHQKPTVLRPTDRPAATGGSARQEGRRRRQKKAVILQLPVTVPAPDRGDDRGPSTVGGYAASAGA